MLINIRYDESAGKIKYGVARTFLDSRKNEAGCSIYWGPIYFAPQLPYDRFSAPSATFLTFALPDIDRLPQQTNEVEEKIIGNVGSWDFEVALDQVCHSERIRFAPTTQSEEYVGCMEPISRNKFLFERASSGVLWYARARARALVYA